MDFKHKLNWATIGELSGRFFVESKSDMRGES